MAKSERLLLGHEFVPWIHGTSDWLDEKCYEWMGRGHCLHPRAAHCAAEPAAPSLGSSRLFADKTDAFDERPAVPKAERDANALWFIRGVQAGSEQPQLAGDGDAMGEAFRELRGQDVALTGEPAAPAYPYQPQPAVTSGQTEPGAPVPGATRAWLLPPVTRPPLLFEGDAEPAAPEPAADYMFDEEFWVDLASGLPKHPDEQRWDRLAEIAGKRTNYGVGFRTTISVDAAGRDRILEAIDTLKADLARVSEEMGLPATIGPAPGELRRFMAECVAAQSQLSANATEIAGLEKRAFNAEDEVRLLRRTSPDDLPSDGNEGIVAGLRRLVLAHDRREDFDAQTVYFNTLGLRTRAAQAAEVIETLRIEIAGLRGQLDEVSSAVGSVCWMDPPDGGSVSLGEQVRRMRGEIAEAEALLRQASHESGCWPSAGKHTDWCVAVRAYNAAHAAVKGQG